MKEIVNLVWVDPDHIVTWSPHFQSLKDNYGFNVTQIPYFKKIDIVNNCEGKDIIVIHSGTYVSNQETVDLIEDIRKRYPNISIGLEANAKHDDLEKKVDFFIYKPISPIDLQSELRNNLK